MSRTSPTFRLCFCKKCHGKNLDPLHVLKVTWMCDVCIDHSSVISDHRTQTARCGKCGNERCQKSYVCSRDHIGYREKVTHHAIYPIVPCITQYDGLGAPIYNPNIVCAHDSSDCSPHVILDNVCKHMICTRCLTRSLEAYVTNHRDTVKYLPENDLRRIPPMKGDIDGHCVFLCMLCLTSCEPKDHTVEKQYIASGDFDLVTYTLLLKSTLKQIREYANAEYHRRSNC